MLNFLPDEMQWKIGYYITKKADMASLSIIDCYRYNLFQPVLRLKGLLQAVIDDDTRIVKKILDVNPNVLLAKPDKTDVITSQYTWQTFYAEKALIMAAKRRQLKMIKLLLSYTSSSTAEALAAWIPYDVQNKKIVIPQEYALYAKSLVDVFREDNCKDKLNEKTESALFELYNLLLPKNAVTLDNAIDPELFLLALYTALDKVSLNPARRLDWRQSSAFWIRVIGLVQSVLSPEAAKIFCESIERIYNQDVRVSEDAEKLTLKSGESYYRKSRDSRSGLGYEFYVGVSSKKDTCGVWLITGLLLYWEHYLVEKQQIFEVLQAERLRREGAAPSLMAHQAI